MKITDIRFTGLAGGTVEGGWVDELKPEDDVHTIVEVLTDEGLAGVGSAFTSKALVEAAVKLLEPFLIGERADEPMPRHREAPPKPLLAGPRRRRRARHQRHRHRPLGPVRQDLQSARRPAPGRLLPRNASSPTARSSSTSRPAAREALGTVARGFKAIKLGWRPFGRRDRKTDELLIQHGARHGRRRRRVDGRCRRQRAILAARLQMGPGNGQDARRLRRRLVRGGLAARRPRGVHRAAPPRPAADRDGRGADAAAEFPPLHRARMPWTSSSRMPPSAAG